jgi:hypothetical protein
MKMEKKASIFDRFNPKTIEGLLSIFALILLLKFFVFGLFMPSISDEAVHMHEAYLTSAGLKPDLDFYLQYHPVKVYFYSAIFSLVKNPFVFIILMRMFNLGLLVFLCLMINKLYQRFTGLSSTIPGLIFFLGSSVSSFAMHSGQLKPDFLAMLLIVSALLCLHSYVTHKRTRDLIIAAAFMAISGMTSSKIIFPIIAINLWVIYQNRKKNLLKIIADSVVLNLPLAISFLAYVVYVGGINSYLYNHVILVSGISPLSMGLKNTIIDVFYESIQGPFMVLFLLLAAYLLLCQRKRIFAQNSRSTLFFALSFLFIQLVGTIIICLRLGYLTPLLIPLSILIVPYLQKLDKKTEKMLVSLLWLAFIFYIFWMCYIHVKFLSYMLFSPDVSRGYRSIFEQAKDYSCLNISENDSYFAFYDFVFHPIFIKDSEYYYVVSKMDKLSNYDNRTDEALKKATIMLPPKTILSMDRPANVRASVEKYQQYVDDNFEPVCLGMYLRRKTTQD